MATRIPYVSESWNPVQGCERFSPGCDRCYAKGIAHRFKWGLTHKTPAGVEWTGEVRPVPSALVKPLRWKKPRRVLVPSMGDLFHSGVATSWIASVFGAMALCPDHLFLVLTKRIQRANWFLRWLHACDEPNSDTIEAAMASFGAPPGVARPVTPGPWPLPNVLIGVTVEDETAADVRFPYLAQIAALGWRTWVSAEPLLGPLDTLCKATIRNPRPLGSDVEWIPPLAAGVEFVAVGGEKGPGARPCAVQWIGRIILQCDAAGVPVHVKQLAAGMPTDPKQWPALLRRQALPSWRR